MWIDRPLDFFAGIESLPRLTMQQFKKDQASGGTPVAVLGFGYALYTLAVAILYAAYPVLFIWLALKTGRDRRLIPAAIILATLAYTGVSGYTAIGEARRNLVYVPALVFLLFYLPARARPASSHSP